MNWIEYFGYLGAFLTSVTFVPQVYKVWQTKSVKDLSLAMMCIVVLSTTVWLIYAVTLVLWPVIVANAIVFISSLMLIYFKFAYQKPND